MRVLIIAGLIVLLAGAAPATAQTGTESQRHNDRLAMHYGSPHSGTRHGHHHGMGRGGKGFCPQNRTVPTAPDEFQKMKNPLEFNEENLFQGESFFHVQSEPTTCKICHGPKGNGLGMMAQGKNSMPRNFTCKEMMKEIADGQMFWIIRNGSAGTGMPAFKTLSDKEIWQLILYIKTFARRR